MAAAESIRLSFTQWEGEVAAASPAGRGEVAVAIAAEEADEQLQGTAGLANGSGGGRG